MLQREWNWQTACENFDRFLSKTMDITESSLLTPRKPASSVISVGIENLASMLIDKRINHSAQIAITGVYSEYLPIFNMSLLFPTFAPMISFIENATGFNFPPLNSPCFALPIRIRHVQEIGLACVFSIRSKSVYEACLPVFHINNKSPRNQKNLTGKIVRMIGNIIDIPERWGKVFCPNQILKIIESPSNTRYLGFLVHNIEVLKSAKIFYGDLWRLDHFHFEDPDEEKLEFYRIDTKSDWPNGASHLTNYLTLLGSNLIKKLVTSFGIVPKVNLLDPSKLKVARDLLRDYYVRTYQKSVPGKTLIPINTIGHGICSSTILRRSRCIFQCDQVKPLLDQEFTTGR